jgi:16S rRNA processing protein RimM
VADPAAYVSLARILRPRGVRGEVAAEILTDFPERLVTLREVVLSGAGSLPRPARVLRCWLSPSRGGQAIFHFAGCDSMAAAEKLRGLEVQVPLSERVVLPAGRYFVTDLIGCEVFERAPAGANEALPGDVRKALLGVVREVQFTGDSVSGTPLLVVEPPRGPSSARRDNLLIPLAQDICTQIDTAARIIEVVLPEGLRELNADS